MKTGYFVDIFGNIGVSDKVNENYAFLFVSREDAEEFQKEMKKIYKKYHTSSKQAFDWLCLE